VRCPCPYQSLQGCCSIRLEAHGRRARRADVATSQVLEFLRQYFGKSRDASGNKTRQIIIGVRPSLSLDTLPSNAAAASGMARLTGGGESRQHKGAAEADALREDPKQNDPTPQHASCTPRRCGGVRHCVCAVGRKQLTSAGGGLFFFVVLLGAWLADSRSSPAWGDERRTDRPTHFSVPSALPRRGGCTHFRRCQRFGSLASQGESHRDRWREH
jgi:hypothetical protein